MLREAVLIPLKPRPFNHVPIFLFKRPRAVVNALVIDIVDDGFFVADATRKCAVLLTPTLKTWKKSFLLRSLATALLNVAHEVAQCY